MRSAGLTIDQSLQTYIGLLDNVTQGLNAVSRQHGGYLTLTPHTTLHCMSCSKRDSIENWPISMRYDIKCLDELKS